VIEEKELPKSWVWTAIGEVADTTSGGTPSRNHPQYYGGSIPWVKSGELKDSIITTVEEFITTEGLKNSSAKVFQQGTALVAMYGATVGKTGILGLDAATNQAICAIFPLKEAFTAKFIIYWLQFQRQNLIDRSSGGAQPNINQETVRNFPLPLAPLSEQHCIVAAIEQQFSRLDVGVAALKRAKAKLKRYRAAVLKAAVEGKLTESWRAEHPTTEPATQLLERILQERRAKWEADLRAKGKDPAKVKYVEPAIPDVEGLPELPEGWCWATPKQLASTNKYSLAIGPFGSNLKVEDYQERGVPLVFVRNIRSKFFDGPDTRYVTASKAAELRAHRVFGGDILITKMGDPPGDACLYPEISSPAIITADCIKWTLSPLLPQCRFFVNAANSSIVRTQILGITRGVAQLKVSLGRFEGIAFPLPPLNEQDQIVSEVERHISLRHGSK
jgi:type I restriction enzyme, S subunit